MSSSKPNGAGSTKVATDRLRKMTGGDEVEEELPPEDPLGTPPEEPPVEPEAAGAEAADAHEGVRRFPGERGDELPRGVGDLADPVLVRSHAPRVGGTMLNTEEARLFGPDGAIFQVYDGHQEIRSGAWRLMKLQALGDVEARIQAARPEMARELSRGEADRQHSQRLDESIAELKQQIIPELRGEVAAAEEAAEAAIEARAAIRDRDLKVPEPTTDTGADDPDYMPVPMPGAPLERVAIALAGRTRIVWPLELVALTVVLGTVLAGKIPSHWPFAIDVYLACAGVASGMLMTGAVFGWALAGTSLPRRASAGLFTLIAAAVVVFGITQIEAAYGASVADQARQVFVVGSFGAVLLAAFTSYIDVVYRAHARVRTAIEQTDGPLTDEAGEP